MARAPRPIGELLADIVSWGERVATFVEGLTFEDFDRSDLHQMAVVKCIEAIGEAAGSIRRHYPEFASQHPEIEFEEAYRARNRLSHGYDSIDMLVVWPAATSNVPKLVAQVRAVVSAA